MPAPPEEAAVFLVIKVLYARITIPIWKGAMIWEIFLVNITKCLLWAFAVSWNGSMSGHIPVRWQGLRDFPAGIETTENTELRRLYFNQHFTGQRDCLGQEESNVPYARKGGRRNADFPQTTAVWRGWNRDSKELLQNNCIQTKGCTSIWENKQTKKQMRVMLTQLAKPVQNLWWSRLLQLMAARHQCHCGLHKALFLLSI